MNGQIRKDKGNLALPLILDSSGKGTGEQARGFRFKSHRGQVVPK